MAKKQKTSDETSGEALPPAAPGTMHISIKGRTFTAQAPYSEGHVLTAAEALTLNQTRSENLRNNFSTTIEKAVKAAETAGVAVDEVALQATFAAYEADYVFSGKRQARAPTDPVLAEAHKLARVKIAELARKKNVDSKTFSKEKWAQLITEVLGKMPEIMTVARQRVEDAKSLGSSELDNLLDAA